MAKSESPAIIGGFTILLTLGYLNYLSYDYHWKLGVLASLLSVMFLCKVADK